MKVFGIDPAPSKRSILFDGQRFLSLSPQALKKFIYSLSEPAFIGWDAPLGASIDEECFDLYSREIERFFNNQRKALGIPKGISTLGYAGCPHWTITQYIFSLPILNPSMQRSSEFFHIESKDELERHRFLVAETHPALSIWLFLKDHLRENALFADSWQYKGNIAKSLKQERLCAIADALFETEIVKKLDIAPDVKKRVKEDDDHLDAFVCYVVSTLFVRGSEAVALYGDAKRGSFLLPYEAKIYKEFENFTSHK